MRTSPALANKWYVHYGWSDAARAAALAVRRANAAARAAAGAYPNGKPVLPDITDLPAPSGEASLQAQAGRDQAEADRIFSPDTSDPYEIISDVPRTGNPVVDGGNALIGGLTMVGGAMPGGGVAISRGSGARASAARRRSPFIGGSGDSSFGIPGAVSSSSARYSGLPDSSDITEDPLNNPQTEADRAFKGSYDTYLKQIEDETAAKMQAVGCDPQGYPLNPGPSFGGSPVASAAADPSAAVDEAVALYDRLGQLKPVSPAQQDALYSALDGLNRFTE